MCDGRAPGNVLGVTTVIKAPAPRVAVIGGGISGLAAAHRLLSAAPAGAVEVTVLEASDRFGGWVRTETFAGRPVDFGPDSLLVRAPWAAELCRELGIDDELVSPGSGSARILVGGELKVLPSGILAGLPSGPMPFVRSGLLGPIGLMRAGLDLVLPGSAPKGDESIGRLVRRRLGRQVLDRVIDPLLGGVHAGRCDDLSLAATAPQIASAARADRSLLRGLRKTAPPAPPVGSKPSPVFMGPRGGMQRIADELVSAVQAAGGVLESGQSVVRLEHGAAGRVRVVLDGQDSVDAVEYDAIVLAIPAAPAAKLLRPHAPHTVAALEDLQYASVAQVALAYRPDEVSGLPDGTGFLVPRGEGRLMTAGTFLDQKWPERPRDVSAPQAEAVVIKCSTGRIDDVRFAGLSDEQLVTAIHDELVEILGLPVGATPLASHVYRVSDGLPQYAPGHLDRIAELEGELISAFPRLAVAGAAYRGTSVPHCIRQGREAADTLLRRGVGRAVRV
jgi:oxygen-dependent protoporphyrinogen oxidase